MSDPARRTLLGSPAARLGAYGLILLAALGGGAAVGAAIGPSPTAGDNEVHTPAVVTTAGATSHEPADRSHGDGRHD